jgi:hypothetical protein
MYEILAKLNPGELVGLVALAGGLFCGVVAIVTGCWLEVRRAELTAALKKDMLERGMSAEEIRTVMEAGAKGWQKTCKKGSYSEL